MRRCTSVSATGSPRSSAAAAWAKGIPVPVSSEPTTGGTSAPQMPDAQAGSNAGSGLDQLAIDRQLDGDVAPRRVGVRAHLVSGLDQLDGLLAVDGRQGHVQLDRQLEAAAVVGVQRDLGLDRGIAGLDLRAARDRAEGALEARRVADREELLGVRAPALAAHLARQSQVDLERAVAALAVPLVAPAGDVRLSRVQGLRHGSTIASTASASGLGDEADLSAALEDRVAHVGQRADRLLARLGRQLVIGDALAVQRTLLDTAVGDQHDGVA